MKTLISSINPPLHIRTPSTPKPKTLYHHKNWKIQSSPKGFTSKSPTSTKGGKTIQAENFPRKNFRSGENDDPDDKIPDAVFERIISRILLFTGAPMGIGLVFLQVFSIFKENSLWNVPPWLPILTTFITFGSSALGIAYGTLSTSWDLEEKGSVLGLDEATRNWVEMWKEENS